MEADSSAAAAVPSRVRAPRTAPLRRLNLPTVGATQAAAEAVAATRSASESREAGAAVTGAVASPAEHIVDAERTRYFRRLSALPSAPPNVAATPKPVLKFVDATRGILFALSQIYSALTQHTAVSTDERLVAHFQRVLGIAAKSMSALISALDRFDAATQAGAPDAGVIRAVLDSCNVSVRTFRRVISMLHMQLPQLEHSVNVRFSRTLLLLLCGSMAELRNSAELMAAQADAVAPYVNEERPSEHSFDTLADTVGDESLPVSSTPQTKRGGGGHRFRQSSVSSIARSPALSPMRDVRKPPRSPGLLASPGTRLRSPSSTAESSDAQLLALLAHVTEVATSVWTDMQEYLRVALERDADDGPLDADSSRLRRVRDVDDACSGSLEMTKRLQSTYSRLEDAPARAHFQALAEEANHFVRVRRAARLTQSIIHTSTLIRAVAATYPFPRDMMRAVGDLNQGCSALAVHLHRLASL